MSQRPPGPEPQDPSEQYIRMLAGLEVKLEEIARDQDHIKGELRRIIPRLDTLSAEVKENTRLIHNQARAINAVVDEQLGLTATRVALDKAIEELKIDTAKRAIELERALGALERAHAFTEDRLRRLRDSVVDELAARESSGVMPKPNV